MHFQVLCYNDISLCPSTAAKLASWPSLPSPATNSATRSQVGLVNMLVMVLVVLVLVLGQVLEICQTLV